MGASGTDTRESKDSPLHGLPRRRPIGRTGRTFHPRDGVGTRKGTLRRHCTQFFPHGIPPNVVSDVLDGVSPSENVVVKIHFPELKIIRLPKLESRAKFEDSNEIRQIRALRIALDQQVEMIRHRAICVEKERLRSGTFLQQRNNAVRNFRVRQV